MDFFLFNAPATTETYTLSRQDALPICRPRSRQLGTAGGEPPWCRHWYARNGRWIADKSLRGRTAAGVRSEEHTSELQSRLHLVCRLLLEKKKKKDTNTVTEHARDTVKV